MFLYNRNQTYVQQTLQPNIIPLIYRNSHIFNIGVFQRKKITYSY